MPIHSIHRLFEWWLAQRRMAFRHPPELIQVSGESMTFHFTGITRLLSCVIQSWGDVCLSVHYRGECWDSFGDFAVLERRTITGRYYCGLCIKPAFFASREHLWVTHSFEELLKWTNAQFKPAQWLCLFKFQGCTAAGLKPADHVRKLTRRNDFAYACPVVVGNARRGRS